MYEVLGNSKIILEYELQMNIFHWILWIKILDSKYRQKLY